MEPQRVALFLKQHPQFFEQHPDVLEILQLNALGQTPSLSERQAVLLQQKKNELEKQLHQFLQNGEANDRISEQLHRLTLEIMALNRLDDLLEAIPTLIQEHFAAAQVVLRVWGSPSLRIDARFPAETRLAQTPTSWKTTFRITELRQIAPLEPVCLQELPSDIRTWFAYDLQSFALLPLEHPSGIWGVLGLGSYDIRRFQPTHGTLYLRRLAEILSAALIRVGIA